MKTQLLSQKWVLILFLSLLALNNTSKAQPNRTDISDGKEFWFAIPYNADATTTVESWSDGAAMITVTAKNSTKFFVESCDKLSMPTTEYNISAGAANRIPIPENMYLSIDDNEMASSKGIHISSEGPISVVVHLTRRSVGESFRVYPAEWLGKKYYTMNLWQDEMYTSGSEIKNQVRPAEFVVVATENGTSVTYTPKVKTNRSNAGSARTVTLNKGQSLLVTAATNLAYSWDMARSDLSGSLVTATKPIAVISGHSRAAYPQFPNNILNIGFEYVRNVLCEMLPPADNCGQSFVIIPFKNLNRPSFAAFGGPHSLLRFVAIEGGTVVKKALYNVSTKTLEYINVTNSLAVGEFYDIVVNANQPSYFVSNKPVLAGLYNYSSLEQAAQLTPAGSGALISCIPNERWVSRAVLPIDADNLQNHLYITFKTTDIDKLSFNGVSFPNKFGSAINSIQGTPFSYIVTQVTKGVYDISGTDGARFGAFTSSILDGIMESRCYAAQSDYNYAKLCADTLIFSDETECGVVNGTCRLVATSPDTSCLEFLQVNIDPNNTTNYVFNANTEIKSSTRLFNYTLDVIDPSKTANAKIQFYTKSGYSDTREFTFLPQIPRLDKDYINFGYLNPGDSDSCCIFNLVNSQDYPLTINKIELTDTTRDFRLNLGNISFPLQLLPGTSLPVVVCLTPTINSYDQIIDTVRISNDCYNVILPVYYSNMQSTAMTTDINFGNVMKGTPAASGTFSVQNTGQYSMRIDSLVAVSGSNFSLANTPAFPIMVPRGTQSPAFQVDFLPTDVRSYTDTIRVYTDALPGKLFSVLRGTGIASAAQDGKSEFDLEVSPSSTDDYIKISVNSPEGAPDSKIEIFDMLGNRAASLQKGSIQPGYQELYLSLASLGLSDGLYIIRIDAGGNSFVRKVVLLK